jgi:hypothetical protein
MNRSTKIAILACVLLAAAGSAEAADPPAAPKKLVGEATGDLNGDGVPDRVQLLQSDDTDVDLAIYLSAAGKPADQPSLYKPGFGWADMTGGDPPGLKITPKGSLIVEFRNDQGRDRWRQQFTIAVRNNALVVAGYSYESRDALEPKAGGGCDLNLLTGTGTRNLKPVKLTAGGVPVAGWSDASIPPPCKFE